MLPLMIRWSFAAIASFASIVLGVGCSESNPYAGPVPRTISTLVPPGAEVHGEYYAEFGPEDDPVRLTFVEYGELDDCASSCVSATVCAIEDSTGVELYYAWWNPLSTDEFPIDILNQCPGVIEEPDGTISGQCEPIGKTHPITETDDFRRFAEENSYSGVFRFCFGDYAANACLWSPCS